MCVCFSGPCVADGQEGVSPGHPPLVLTPHEMLWPEGAETNSSAAQTSQFSWRAGLLPCSGAEERGGTLLAS